MMLDFLSRDNVLEGEPPAKVMREGPNADLRFLISTRIAGIIIGKGGEDIKKIREEYSVTINIPDSNGPERVLMLEGDLVSILEILHGVFTKIVQDPVEDYVDLRLLVHQSQAGCVIGKAGLKIKELREQSGLKTLKVHQMLCPGSTDRVVQLMGNIPRVISCLQAIAELLGNAPPKGSRQNYDARNFDEGLAYEYGGWCMNVCANTNPGFVNRRNQLSQNYLQDSVFPAGLFTGLPGTGANASTATQAAVVSQALAGGLQHASAAAILAAAGGQAHGTVSSGPTGDAAASAAIVAGMMREMSGRVGMNFLAPTTTTQVSISNKLIGSIMGRGGIRINKVRKESGADIKISSQEPGVEDRIITITGTPEQIQNAQFYLQLCVKRFGESS